MSMREGCASQSLEVRRIVSHLAPLELCHRVEQASLHRAVRWGVARQLLVLLVVVHLVWIALSDKGRSTRNGEEGASSK